MIPTLRSGKEYRKDFYSEFRRLLKMRLSQLKTKRQVLFILLLMNLMPQKVQTQDRDIITTEESIDLSERAQASTVTIQLEEITPSDTSNRSSTGFFEPTDYEGKIDYILNQTPSPDCPICIDETGSRFVLPRCNGAHAHCELCWNSYIVKNQAPIRCTVCAMVPSHIDIVRPKGQISQKESKKLQVTTRGEHIIITKRNNLSTIRRRHSNQPPRPATYYTNRREAIYSYWCITSGLVGCTGIGSIVLSLIYFTNHEPESISPYAATFAVTITTTGTVLLGRCVHYGLKFHRPTRTRQ